MAIEGELVLRGTVDPTSELLKTGNYQLLNQYESHNHTKRGMITNRCRETQPWVDGVKQPYIYSAATKYMFSLSETEKQSVELEKDVTFEEFEIIANMLNEHIVKKRITLPQDGYNIEIDIFVDVGTMAYTCGFKIDIEGDVRPSQEDLNGILTTAGFKVTEWLGPKEWGGLYNAKVREVLPE